MNGHRMFELAQTLAVAKSRQDVPAAMRLFHRDMVLETPAFGTTARGPAENKKALTRFFRSFPDPAIASGLKPQSPASEGAAAAA